MPDTPLKSPLSQKRPFHFQKQNHDDDKRMIKNIFYQNRKTKTNRRTKNIINIKPQIKTFPPFAAAPPSLRSGRAAYTSRRQRQTAANIFKTGATDTPRKPAPRGEEARRAEKRRANRRATAPALSAYSGLFRQCPPATRRAAFRASGNGNSAI
jgi:hypothetical protein